MKESAARIRILEVASRLFYEQGYHSTGINQIVEEAHIAKASLYNHFASKTDLLTAYLLEADKAWFAGLNKFLLPFKDPRARLLALFDYRAERQAKSNFGGCQFIKVSAEISSDEQAVFKLIAGQKDHAKTFMKDILRQIKRTEQPLLSLDMLTDTLYLLLEGATVTASINKDAEVILKAKKIAEKLI